MTTICVFGASEVYGYHDAEDCWVQRLRKLLEKKETPDQDIYYTVYNCGVSGDNTEDLLKRFEVECYARYHESVGIYKEKFIVIFSIGLNDTQYLHDKKGIRISEIEFRNNIKKLMNLAKKFTSNIIFVGFYPIEEDKTNPLPWNDNISYRSYYVKTYNEILQFICKENNLAFVDVFNRFSKNYKNLLLDGLHPNSEGHKKIFELIRDFLTKKKCI